ncbi:hypothetical protein HPB49_008778 [Dermacentor silvarum]|uniref:Uncharacterized protein n=1 Tax=Dermacentor silvarum TaxID=543639 RepID=A0ACB8DCG8_DERSI|nr:hypothetical protein HPB49_008778 [Dermacentor silvarum]
MAPDSGSSPSSRGSGGKECADNTGASRLPPSVPSPLKAARLARTAATSLSTNSASPECLRRIRAAAAASSMAAPSRRRLRRAALRAALASSYFRSLPRPQLGPGAQVEAQLATQRITADLTRYRHIVSGLPPATTNEARNLLLAPPAKNTYQTLKETLIRRLTPPEPERRGALRIMNSRLDSSHVSTTEALLMTLSHNENSRVFTPEAL